MAASCKPWPACSPPCTAGDDLLRQRLAELGPQPWHASGAFQPPQSSLTLSFKHDGRSISLPLGSRPPAEDALQALLAAASASPFAKKASRHEGQGLRMQRRGG